MSNVIRQQALSQICIWPNSSHVPVSLGHPVLPKIRIRERFFFFLSFFPFEGRGKIIIIIIIFYVASHIILLGLSCSAIFSVWHLNKSVHDDKPRLHLMPGMNVTSVIFTQAGTALLHKSDLRCKDMRLDYFLFLKNFFIFYLISNIFFTQRNKWVGVLWIHTLA